MTTSRFAISSIRHREWISRNMDGSDLTLEKNWMAKPDGGTWTIQKFKVSNKWNF
jgi:hypothetical protein